MTNHHDPHSEQGALAGEHPGRARNPIVKAHDLAWLEFEKPDLERAEVFAHAFGFSTALRTRDEDALLSHTQVTAAGTVGRPDVRCHRHRRGAARLGRRAAGKELTEALRGIGGVHGIEVEIDDGSIVATATIEPAVVKATLDQYTIRWTVTVLP
jgi:hypothetical protein